jgi:hypothetical protein
MPPIILKPDNFLKDSVIVKADTGAELLEKAIETYQLDHVPKSLEVQVWSGPFGTTRHRLDTLAVIEGTDPLFGYVRIARRDTCSLVAAEPQP